MALEYLERETGYGQPYHFIVRPHGGSFYNVAVLNPHDVTLEWQVCHLSKIQETMDFLLEKARGDFYQNTVNSL